MYTYVYDHVLQEHSLQPGGLTMRNMCVFFAQHVSAGEQHHVKRITKLKWGIVPPMLHGGSSHVLEIRFGLKR